jgi:1,4-dihydroxy-2-naphthoate octaprenyltransferase
MPFSTALIANWVRAFRLPAQINLALPMLVGMVHGAACPAQWAGLPLFNGLLISLLLQAMILYSNDASDANTDKTHLRTLISGGSGVGAEGGLSVAALRRGAVLAGCMGLLLCAWTGGLPMAVLWLAAAVLVWAYDGATLRLSRHPLGSLCQAIGVGVIVPLLGAALVAAPQWPLAQNVWLGLSLGMSGHILSALPDEQADRAVGKRTIVVTLGAPASYALMLAGIGAAGTLLLFLHPQESCLQAVKESADSAQWAFLGLLCVLMACAWLRSQGATVRRQLGGLPLDLWLSGLASVAVWVGWIVLPFN